MKMEFLRTVGGGGGGTQHFVLRVNEPKKTGARSARARTAANTHYLNIEDKARIYRRKKLEGCIV
jgi:hypothetical protein